MHSEIGEVRIAPQVLAAVAALAALSVPGVASLSTNRPLRMGLLLRRTAAIDTGVAVTVENGSASFEVFLVVDRSVNMLETSRRVQSEVARAIRETVGMPVQSINIHVEDVAVDVAGPR
jgi:uncharacterized alkaline shock family protein YloU